MKKVLRKHQAAKIIGEHFKDLQEGDQMISGRDAGLLMILVFRTLTGEMPQSAGIDVVVTPDGLPGLEFSSPVTSNPNNLFSVIPWMGVAQTS